MKTIPLVRFTLIIILSLVATSPAIAAPDGQSTSQTAALPLSAMEVRKMQTILHTLGYEVGPIDGIYGPLTSRAVVRFQVDHGINLSGYPDAEFQTRLLEAAHALRADAE